MRRLFSLFLLLLLLANFAGGYVYFFLRAVQIKRDMRELLKTLPDDELERIILTSEEFKTARVEDHEIKVDGKMYDIARIEIVDDTLHVYCKHDEDEDNLLSLLDAFLNNIQQDKQPVPHSITQFTGLHFLPVNSNISLNTSATEIDHCVIYNQSDYELYLPVIIPPPKA